MAAHCQPGAVPDPETRGGPGVARDGKAQRGRRRCQPGGGPVHARTAVGPVPGLVLAQEPLARTADKAEAAVPVAPALLARVAWRGRVLPGDARFCHRRRCRQVRDAGGDDLLPAQEHQPARRAALALRFDPPTTSGARPRSDRRAAVTVEQGHGRTQDQRHLGAASDRKAYLAWPGIAQGFRLEPGAGGAMVRAGPGQAPQQLREHPPAARQRRPGTAARAQARPRADREGPA